jgi:hypothetical protein
MILILALSISLLCYLLDFNGATAISIGLLTLLFFRLLLKSRDVFAFREFALFLYAINYLLSPLITYSLDENLVTYPMKIEFDDYFLLSIPGFILFGIGMYSIPTKCFNLRFNEIKQLSYINERFLISATLLGLMFKIVSVWISGELAFIIYLLSLIRFVGAFSLISINLRKYIHWPLLIVLVELAFGFINGAYHDAIMWVIFFGLYYVYVIKPSFIQILTGGFSAVLLLLVIQAVKYKYREEVWQGSKQASFETVYLVGSEQVNSEKLIGQENLLSTLNRGNQAWILASTIDNMDQKQNFQGLKLVSRYFEAAILPRFLAPNKIKSGDQEIFNEFSGHHVNESTAMGLGVFADGYIAYGTWGVYIFGFALGLIFALTFKLVERWTKVSPFYVLLLLPLLNYAVRPDCELQTTINHLFKGILLYGFLVYLTRKRFTLDSQDNQRKLAHLNLVSRK